MTKLKVFLLAGTIVRLALFVSSCQLPQPPEAAAASIPWAESMTISIDHSSMPRTLAPDVDTTPAYYIITGDLVDGTAPKGDSFSITTTEPWVTVKALKHGDWVFIAEAFNAADVLVARGQTSRTITTGQEVTIEIAVDLLDGHGVLDLVVRWSAGRLNSPSVRAQLVPEQGTAMDLFFELGGDFAVSVTPNVPAGGHTLLLTLLDDGNPVMDVAEPVRMVREATTTGSFALEEPGSLEIGIAPELREPLQVTIEGVPPTFPVDGSVTAVGSVSPDPGSIMYTWYLNGSPSAEGQAWTLDPELPAGFYRIDLVAVSDGQRAGSTSTTFRVP
jgi:hypothetical protein